VYKSSGFLLHRNRPIINIPLFLQSNKSEFVIKNDHVDLLELYNVINLFHWLTLFFKHLYFLSLSLKIVYYFVLNARINYFINIHFVLNIF
jgi:hypothetical protein